MKDATNPKDLLGLTKPPLRLVPAAGIIWTSKAMAFGAYGIDIDGVQVRPKAYGPYNWRDNKVLLSVYIEAAMRHLLARQDGDRVASDSKVPHEAHAAACMMIVLDAMENGNLVDDLPVAGAAAQLMARLTLKVKAP